MAILDQIRAPAPAYTAKFPATSHPRSAPPPSQPLPILPILRALRGQIQKKFGELKAEELLFDT